MQRQCTGNAQSGSLVAVEHFVNTVRLATIASFLIFLRRFYNSETSRNTYLETDSEFFEAWMLMLRLLRPK